MERREQMKLLLRRMDWFSVEELAKVVAQYATSEEAARALFDLANEKHDRALPQYAKRA